MAPNLDTLPVEIISLILSHFCLHCSKEHDYDSPEGYFRHTTNEQEPDQPSWYSHGCRRTLHSLCLVSRRLALIAQPILHHEFIPGYGDAWLSSRFSWAGRLASFLRTMAARRDLAAQVKRIFIHSYLLQAVSENEAHAVLEEVVFPAAVPATGVQLSDYLGAFNEMQQDVYLPSYKRVKLAGWKLVGAVLALVPNLERLSLRVKSTGGVPVAAFAALHSSPSFSGLVLSRLKTLDIRPHNDGSGVISLGVYANTGILFAVEALQGESPNAEPLRMFEDRPNGPSRFADAATQRQQV